VALFLKCAPLTPKERRIWVLDQKINLRGFAVDRPLVETVLTLVSEEAKELDREALELSDGDVKSARQAGAVKAWLEANGTFLPNLQKQTVADALAGGLVEGVGDRRMLELRLAASKSSTAKYEAFEKRSRHDSKVRDILTYHAATTGRWGGAGVQPQNFPRGTIKNTAQAADVLASGDLEFVRLVYGDPMGAFSSCLRSMIVSSGRDRTLDVADYAAIEARVLFWLARHERGLDAFRQGRDLYKEQAVDVYGVTLDKITPAQRFLGKTLILGAGFGLGAKKFYTSVLAQGGDISPELAEAAIKAYRSTHSPVVRLWSLIEKAAIAAIENRGKRYNINYTSWFLSGEFLFCELPSGRRLAYHRPEVVYEPTPWGEKRPVVYYWCVDGYTRQWTRVKTYGGCLVENITQATARDLMAEAMLRIEAAGWEIVLSVHDELVAERDVFGDGTLEEFLELMEKLPDWATGLPCKVEGWSGSRYRK
jgi:DNA polymerase